MPQSELKENKITWVNVDHLTSKDTEELKERFKLHPLDLQDCLSVTQSPKIDIYDEYIFLILHFPTYDTETNRVIRQELNIFIGDGYLLTLHKKTLPPLQTIFLNCKDNPDIRKTFFRKSPGFLLYKILYLFSKDLYPLLDTLKENMLDVEEDMYEGENDVIRKISAVQRSVLNARRILNPDLSIIGTVVNLRRSFLGADSDVYFDDVLDHLKRAWSVLENNREIIEALHRTNEALISHRTNEIMRILTVISVSFLPLTIIGTLYGMNISLPFANHEMAFFGIVGGTVVFILLILLIFKKQDWI